MKQHKALPRMRKESERMGTGFGNKKVKIIKEKKRNLDCDSS